MKWFLGSSVIASPMALNGDVGAAVCSPSASLST